MRVEMVLKGITDGGNTMVTTLGIVIILALFVLFTLTIVGVLKPDSQNFISRQTSTIVELFRKGKNK
jgi:hypothetical protein